MLEKLYEGKNMLQPVKEDKWIYSMYLRPYQKGRRHLCAVV
ncbi:hypothetical protein MNV_560083 [Candidatus Methanoperedens nitroreducens]|uniref:Uncharacterized protein n=1 Tax=Candidatus Methanoperedens nitratireducens TaxID=1392998 RepID=A0A284VS72_9EURY|nr:hypothetical protein MNV_560083 [Candidatus Methanoperedens nitroreducens]